VKRGLKQTRKTGRGTFGPDGEKENSMKTRTIFTIASVVVFAAFFAIAAAAYNGGGQQGKGGPPSKGGPQKHDDRRDGPGDRHGSYRRDHIDKPLATLALCVLYPAKCRPHPVVVHKEAVIIVKQPVIVNYPQTGDAVDIQMEGDGLSQYTGSWWSGLPEHSKLQFVSVYVQSHKGADAVMFKGKSYGVFVKGLNEFYLSRQNQSLSVDKALDVVTLKLNGYANYGDCMNGYYIMASSPNLFTAETINAKYDECSKYRQPSTN
jgi:hypothetical protein